MTGTEPEPPAAVCAVCRTVLEPTVYSHGGVTYRHSGRAEAEPGFDQHDPLPITDADIEVRSICDFCGAFGAEWDYPCADFDVYHATDADGHTETMTLCGEWAACIKCHRDIGAGRWANIIKRHGDNQRAIAGSVSPAHDALVSNLLAGFRQHRLGPPSHHFGDDATRQ